MKIAYLGPEKTFTQEAARKAFPDAELIPVATIKNLVNSIENSLFDYGVVPIENFYNGYVIHTLDSMTQSKDVRIVKEISMNILHCLGVLKKNSKINKIYSKDQALEQCGDYLSVNYPEAQAISVSSTAEAVEYIKNSQLTDSGVIASREAIIKSGLEIIAEDICPGNKTRFVIIGKEETSPTGDDKTFISVHPPIRDEPGVLADCLSIFRSQHINLECIHSRPDKKEGYFFYIELNGHEKDENLQIALKALRYSLDPSYKYEDTIKILGSFPNSHWKENRDL
jgi:chorismate mutase/prephenate dehydratase